MRRVLGGTTVLMIGLAFSACAGGRLGSVEGDPSSIDTGAPVRVQVQNDHIVTVNVFAVYASERFRMGTVVARRDETFPLPAVIPVETRGVQFLIDPIGGGRAFLSDDIHARPGETIFIRVNQAIQTTSISVR